MEGPTVTNASAGAPAALTHRRVIVAFSGLMLAILLAALDATIVATALPTIVGELGGLSHLSWVVTSYLLAQTVVTPLYGKLGDLYGRKRVLQSGVVLFLIGSALCGISRTMMQLVLFRALQGLGGGGLMVTAQATVGDLVSARERGRYQGIFGAVFGIASIAGPLLGGFFTTHLSWRWIFYVNLPVGVLAIVVLAATLPSQATRQRHAIDWTGAGLLAIVLAALVLLTDLGGGVLPWTSPGSWALGAATVLGLVGFVVSERHAREPVLPLELFQNPSFTLSCLVGLIVGFALFGSVTYLPLFLQIVQRADPTTSGLLMLPFMGGMLLTSIASGQYISRTGRYRAFPIIGSAVMTLGLFLFSRMQPGVSMLETMAYMLIVGLGLGMVMQVLVIIVQNAVDYRVLGVATSGSLMFRLVGGSLGTAVLGAILAARLRVELPRLLPPGAAHATPLENLSPAALAQLARPLRAAYAQALTSSLDVLFLVAAFVSFVGFVLTWLIPEKPLKGSVAATAGSVGDEVGETFPMPTDPEALPQLLRGLSLLADRDFRRKFIERIVQRAGVDLSVPAAWLLVRIDSDPTSDHETLRRIHRVPREWLETGWRELVDRGLVTAGQVDHRPGGQRLTEEGCAILRRLVAARRERLAELFAEWDPERHERLAELLGQLARELVPEAPEAGGKPNAT